MEFTVLQLVSLALVPSWYTYEKKLDPFSSPVLQSGSCKQQQGLLFSELKIPSFISLFVWIMFSTPWLFWRPLDWLCSMCQYCSCTEGAPNQWQYWDDVLWKIISLALSLIQLKTLLATLAARAQSWHTFKLSSRTPRSFSASKQLPACCMGLFLPGCKNLESLLWSSLWIAALPSSWIQLSKCNKRM